MKVWKILLLSILTVSIIYKSNTATFFNTTQNHKLSTSLSIQKEDEERSLPIQKESVETLCPPKFFKVGKMKNCHKWLDCTEIEGMLSNIRKYPVIGKGSSKMVYQVPWKKSSIHFALSITTPHGKRTNTYSRRNARMKQGKTNLLQLQSQNYVVQFIGHCEKPDTTIFLTEDCTKHGSLDKFIQTNEFSKFTALQRLNIVIQLIECLVFLHYKSGPSKVHCDMHNPMQALRQFLLRDDKKVVLVDLDELPIDDPNNNKTAKCEPEARCGKSNAEFLAPEQRYTRKECSNVANFSKAATIKSDVWKIPELSKTILTYHYINKDKTDKLQTINDKLAHIYRKCKYENVSLRANSRWVLKEYQRVFNLLNNKK